MVIAKGQRGGRRVVILGLSDASLRALAAGLPLRLDDTHPGGLNDFDIEIIGGQNDRVLSDHFARPGALGADTVIVSVIRDQEGL